jgi:hypothetical protein
MTSRSPVVKEVSDGGIEGVGGFDNADVTGARQTDQGRATNRLVKMVAYGLTSLPLPIFGRMNLDRARRRRRASAGTGLEFLDNVTAW